MGIPVNLDIKFMLMGREGTFCSPGTSTKHTLLLDALSLAE